MSSSVKSVSVLVVVAGGLWLVSVALEGAADMSALREQIAEMRGPDEVQVARGVLGAAQMISFAENLEFCGYLGFDSQGALRSSEPVRGLRDECTPLWPADLEVTASWHTHAGYDLRAWSEVPTVMDIEADEDEGIDGYVATPGGRFWFVDTEAMEVVQLCARAECVPVDPAYEPGAEGDIWQSYSYQDLLDREAAQ